MNFKFKVYLCTWFFYQNLIIFASALPTKLNDHQPIESLSSIHMALDQVSQSDLFTFNIFGAQGIGMDSYQIESLKKVYLYLIFLTKLEKVAKDPKFAAYKSDFLEFLQDNGTAMPHLPTAQLLNSQGWLSVVITAQDIVLIFMCTMLWCFKLFIMLKSKHLIIFHTLKLLFIIKIIQIYVI